MTDSKRFMLSRQQLEALDEALDPEDLHPATRIILEGHISAYRDHRRRILPGGRERWRKDQERLVKTARKLLRLIDRSSVEDYNEGVDRASCYSELQETLNARVEQWQRRAQRRFPSHHPEERDRLVLLAKALAVIDDSGFLMKRSWHKEGARVRVLKVVLQIADAIDGKPIGKGSQRMINKIAAAHKAGTINQLYTYPY